MTTEEHILRRILNTFVENTNTSTQTEDGKEQQGLSKAVKPRTDV